MSETAAILEVRELTKAFGGVVALNRVSFAAKTGAITGVIGPNGAGKSTLFNLVAGTISPTAGEVWFAGRCINGLPAYARVAAGIARTFQAVELFGNMSALENLMVGQHSRTSAGILQGALRTPAHRTEERLIRDDALELLRFVGLERKAGFPALNLPFGQQRLLAMARALASKPRLLLLDEPGAGLNAREKHNLADLIRQLAAGGLTVLLVEHDMELVMGVTEHIIVLDYGEKIAQGNPAEIQADELVIAAYLGSDDDLDEGVASDALVEGKIP